MEIYERDGGAVDGQQHLELRLGARGGFFDFARQVFQEGVDDGQAVGDRGRSEVYGLIGVEVYMVAINLATCRRS